MSLSEIKIIKGAGGLGRRLPGSDHYTGLVYYHDVALTGDFIDLKKQFFSLNPADHAGITAEDYAVLNYHISEYFRINPAGSLWVGMFDLPVGAHDFTEVTTLQDETGGLLRQIGVFTSQAYDSAQVTALQSIAASAESNHSPFSAVLAADISDADLTTLDDLTSSLASKVSVLIGQDGGGVGASLFALKGFSISAIGAVIGAISSASVHESIAWVGKFNLSGAELDSLAFGDGTLLKDTTKTLLNEVSDKRYIFLVKYSGVSGSFVSRSWTSDQGDYETIELNRTIDKAIRNVRTVLLPFSSSPLYVNQLTGKLSEDTIQAFIAEGNRGLDTMFSSGELSGRKVKVDPDQNVLSTSTIEVTVELLPVGVASTIEVTIGFTTQLS